MVGRVLHETRSRSSVRHLILSTTVEIWLVDLPSSYSEGDYRVEPPWVRDVMAYLADCRTGSTIGVLDGVVLDGARVHPCGMIEASLDRLCGCLENSYGSVDGGV